jgi:enamine deaminase RidA (YjgF/YER057c/UK114 family)
MNTMINSPKIIPPTSYYSHAVEVGPNSRTVFASGQIAVSADGKCADDFVTQARQCWSNLVAVLEAASMGLEDVVRVQAYVTGQEYLADYRAVRNEVVGNLRPAHTLLVVAALGKPEWKVELEAIAAKEIK